MARYCSHTIILPDENCLDNFVVEVNGCVTAYYPFTGEIHSTIYIDQTILISYRADLDGRTISLSQMAWALHDAEHGSTKMYAYYLTPCSSCMGNRFIMKRL